MFEKRAIIRVVGCPWRSSLFFAKIVVSSEPGVELQGEHIDLSITLKGLEKLL